MSETRQAGGPDPQLFSPTHWSLIRRAQADSTGALDALLALYRPAIVAWLQARGMSLQFAEDVVQGFFLRLLEREFLAKVSRDKGRFRTFILTSLQNYLRDLYRHDAAAKRGGGAVPESLEATDSEGRPVHAPPGVEVGPDLAFDRAWARAILESALKQVEAECSRTGHGPLCAALEPVLFHDPDAPAYAELALKLKMSEGALKMAALRIRQRLKGLIREQVLQTLDDESQLPEELGYLKSLFARP